MKGEIGMLFSKSKPTETLTFGDSFVELQHLSKGVLDEIRSRSIKAFSTAGPAALAAMQNAKDESQMPAELLAQTGEMLKIQQYKVAQAIKTWSADEPVTEDNVRALEPSVFDEISKKVDEMNQLSQIERKN